MQDLKVWRDCKFKGHAKVRGFDTPKSGGSCATVWWCTTVMFQCPMILGGCWSPMVWHAKALWSRQKFKKYRKFSIPCIASSKVEKRNKSDKGQTYFNYLILWVWCKIFMYFFKPIEQGVLVLGFGLFVIQWNCSTVYSEIFLLVLSIDWWWVRKLQRNLAKVMLLWAWNWNGGEG